MNAGPLTHMSKIRSVALSCSLSRGDLVRPPRSGRATEYGVCSCAGDLIHRSYLTLILTLSRWGQAHLMRGSILLHLRDRDPTIMIGVDIEHLLKDPKNSSARTDWGVYH